MKNNTSNNYGRIIIRQGIILIISLCFFAVPVVIDVYLGHHVIRPCGIERIPLCDYDTKFSLWLNNTKYWYSTTEFFHQTYLLSGTIYRFLATITKPFDRYLPSIIMLFGWIGILNAVWFIVNLLFKKIIKENRHA